MVTIIDMGPRREPADILDIRTRWSAIPETNPVIVDVHQLLTRISELNRQLSTLEHHFQEVIDLSKESTCGIIALYERRLREFEQRLSEVYQSQI